MGYPVKNFKKLILFMALVACTSIIQPSIFVNKAIVAIITDIQNKIDKFRGVFYSALTKNQIKEDSICPVIKQEDQTASSEEVSSLFNLENYKKNPCVRLCKSEDSNHVYKVLKGNGFRGYSLKEESCETLVYEKDGIIQGVCIFADSGYVYCLSVAKKYQKQGVGKALLYEVMHVLKTKHTINIVTLLSFSSAIPFYKKLGFKFEGNDGSFDFA